MSRAGKGKQHEKGPADPAGTADAYAKRRNGKTARARRVRMRSGDWESREWDWKSGSGRRRQTDFE